MQDVPELLQIADLLRLTAEAARKIAAVKRTDTAEVELLARRIDILADDVASVVVRPTSDWMLSLSEDGAIV